MHLVDLHLFHRLEFCLLPFNLSCQLSADWTCFDEIRLITLHLHFQPLLVFLDMFCQSLNILLQFLDRNFLLYFLPFLFFLISFKHSFSVSPLLLLFSELFLQLFPDLSLFGPFFFTFFSFKSPLSLQVFDMLWEIFLCLWNLNVKIFNFLIFELVWTCKLCDLGIKEVKSCLILCWQLALFSGNFMETWMQVVHLLCIHVTCVS